MTAFRSTSCAPPALILSRFTGLTISGDARDRRPHPPRSDARQYREPRRRVPAGSSSFQAHQAATPPAAMHSDRSVSALRPGPRPIRPTGSRTQSRSRVRSRRRPPGPIRQAVFLASMSRDVIPAGGSGSGASSSDIATMRNTRPRRSSRSRVRPSAHSISNCGIGSGCAHLPVVRRLSPALCARI